MLGYVVRRLLAAIPLLWLVWTLTFLVGRLIPGDPLALYESPNISQESMQRLRVVYGLDDPLPLQYVKQLGATLSGNLALSTSQGRPVSQVVSEAIGPTLILASLALVLQFLLGILLGVISAVRRGPVDHGIMIGALFLYSIPAFWLGVQLILVFSFQLGWLPSSHMHSVGASRAGYGEWLLDMGRHLILPLMTLSLGGAAAIVRYCRGSMLDVMQRDFVRTARSRGLPEWRVVWRHTFSNALMPLVTLVGLSLPFLLSGAVIVEVVFSWPGLGQVAFNAIRTRDYPVVQATTLMTAFLVVAGSFLADLLAAASDPRVRIDDRA